MHCTAPSLFLISSVLYASLPLPHTTHFLPGLYTTATSPLLPLACSASPDGGAVVAGAVMVAWGHGYSEL